MKIPKSGPLFVAVLAVVLVGCVTDDQLAPVRTFSTAATDFSSQAGNALTRLNDSYVDRNISKVASGDGPVTDATFEGLLDNDPGFKASRDALKALGAYATALNSLATATYQADIDKASTDLYGSLSSVEKDAAKFFPGLAKVSDKDLGLFATAVSGIGQVVADKKRVDAIRKAVDLADPGVQAISAGFAETLEGVGNLYRKNLDVIYTSRVQGYKSDYSGLSYDDRLARLAELRSDKLAITTAGDFIDKLSESAKELGKAHAQIKKALDLEKLDAGSLVREVGQLKSLAEDLKSLNASLTKPTK